MSSNGRLKSSELRSIKGGGKLEKNAAKSWNAFARYCKVKHGYDVEVTDSYRKLGAPGDYRRGTWSQYGAWEKYQSGNGNLAARPGTSNHGLGRAVDVPGACQSAIFRWGAEFGWQKKWSDAPSEPWHFCWSSGNAKRKVIAQWSQVQSGDTLYRGDKGPGAKSLKILLRRHGCWPYKYPLNSAYGRITLWWVKKFQRSHRLKADGVVGPATWKALRKPEPKKPAPKKPAPKKPAPKPAPKPVKPKPAPKPVKGIDISGNNGSPFKFSNIKAAGYDFVICKTSEGGDWKDSSWNAARVKAIRDSGLTLGVYHYLRPKPGRSGKVEARFFWSVATSAGYGKRGQDIVPVLDFEETALSPAASYRYLAEAVSELKALSGKAPMIYTGGPFWDSNTKMAKDNMGCPLWLAAYVTNPERYIPEAWDSWTIWQSSDAGKVSGVPSAKVDVNTAKRLPLL